MLKDNFLTQIKSTKMFKTSTFAKPSMAIPAILFAIIAFSFLSCQKTPGPLIPDPQSKWLLSKVTHVTYGGGNRIYEFTYNSFNKPSLIKGMFVSKEGEDTSVYITTLDYDAQQRLVALTDTLGESNLHIIISYDANGRIKTIGPPSGSLIGSTVYEYLDGNKVKDWSYSSAIYEDTLIAKRTFIYNQDGNLVEDTLIDPIVHTGVLDGYDTVLTKYTQYDHHPNPAAFTNTNISLKFLLFHITDEPVITQSNYKKKASTHTGHDLWSSVVAIYSYQYNEAGLVKRSKVETTFEYFWGPFTETETYEYEYIKAGD